MPGLLTITFKDGHCRHYPSGTSLLDVSRDEQTEYKGTILAAAVDNEIKSLQTVLDDDCQVDFLDLTDEFGLNIYIRSLKLIFFTAVRELYPYGDATIEHSLSRGVYGELHIGRDVQRADVFALEKRMRQLIDDDLPIERKIVSRQEAVKLFAQAGQNEKVKLLSQLGPGKIGLYFCGDTYDYMYGVMVPSTGFLQVFGLEYSPPGMVLRYPSRKNPQRLPEYTSAPKLANVYAEAERWGKIMNCRYVSELNDYIRHSHSGDIIRIAEALHEKKIAQIADFIADHRDKAKVILVAGPSSSGKTTFAQRLNIHLRVNGLRPVPVSLDDYFVNRECTPLGADGKYDFEAIEAVDLDLFNRQLPQLLKGQEVELPVYNFKEGRREARGHVLHLDKDQPLIIEGIHGLNERLTSSISRDMKVKIYISAITQLSIDSHNRIPTTEARLIRRIVRDNQFRGHDALKTLQLWPSVRRGEEKNIFPYQEEADVMFNSALIYELAVLKKYVEPLLQSVPRGCQEYRKAARLLDFAEYFTPLSPDDVPATSILREFIGESCFY